jgi:Tfp pilus assembly protein PilZ
VTVAAESEHGGVAGEAVNLSEGGACLAIDDAIFDVGDELILFLHFAEKQRLVPATGRVVWTAPANGQRSRCGLEWTHEGPQRDWIGWLSEA